MQFSKDDPINPVGWTRAVLVCCGMFFMLEVLFRVFPALDFDTPRFFLDSACQCTGMDDGFWWRVRNVPTLLSASLVLAALVLWPLTFWIALPDFDVTAKYWRFVVLLCLFGPGFLVNEVLKRFSCRARPNAIEALGGDREFTLAWNFSDQCLANCSFASAHVAAATALALSLVFAAWLRRSPQNAGPLDLLAVRLTLASLHRNISKQFKTP